MHQPYVYLFDVIIYPIVLSTFARSEGELERADKEESKNEDLVHFELAWVLLLLLLLLCCELV